MIIQNNQRPNLEQNDTREGIGVIYLIQKLQNRSYQRTLSSLANIVIPWVQLTTWPMIICIIDGYFE